jgi:hypothetical protein
MLAFRTGSPVALKTLPFKRDCLGAAAALGPGDCAKANGSAQHRAIHRRMVNLLESFYYYDPAYESTARIDGNIDGKSVRLKGDAAL